MVLLSFSSISNKASKKVCQPTPPGLQITSGRDSTACLATFRRALAAIAAARALAVRFWFTASLRSRAASPAVLELSDSLSLPEGCKQIFDSSDSDSTAEESNGDEICWLLLGDEEAGSAGEIPKASINGIASFTVHIKQISKSAQINPKYGIWGIRWGVEAYCKIILSCSVLLDLTTANDSWFICCPGEAINCPPLTGLNFKLRFRQVSQCSAPEKNTHRDKLFQACLVVCPITPQWRVKLLQNCGYLGL